MALKLDNNLIEELGLGALPEQEKQLLLRQIYEKLEMNVGVRLADQMSNEQLDEFEKFVDANDDKGAFQWLESNFPNYKDVVNQEFEKLKAEIKQFAPQMLAVAAHNSGQAAGAGGQANGSAGQNGSVQGQAMSGLGQQMPDAQSFTPPQQPQPHYPPQYMQSQAVPGPGPQPFAQPYTQQPQSQYTQPMYGQPQQYAQPYQPPFPDQQGPPQYPPTVPGPGGQTPPFPPQQPPAGPGQQ